MRRFIAFLAGWFSRPAVEVEWHRDPKGLQQFSDELIASMKTTRGQLGLCVSGLPPIPSGPRQTKISDTQQAKSPAEKADLLYIAHVGELFKKSAERERLRRAKASQGDNLTREESVPLAVAQWNDWPGSRRRA